MSCNCKFGPPQKTLHPSWRRKLVTGLVPNKRSPQSTGPTTSRNLIWDWLREFQMQTESTNRTRITVTAACERLSEEALELILKVQNTTKDNASLERIKWCSSHASGSYNGNVLLMHFCDSNQEVIRMQKKNNSTTQQKLISFWWKYKNIRKSRFSKLMIVF